jgi:hypothetical protein
MGVCRKAGPLIYHLINFHADVSFSFSTPASSFLWVELGEKLKVCKLLPGVGVDAGLMLSLDHFPHRQGLKEVLLLEVILHSFYPTCQDREHNIHT